MSEGSVRRGLLRLHREERGLVVSFVVRLALALVLTAIAVEETGQVVAAQVRAEKAAGPAAQAAADSYRLNHNLNDAKQAAYAAVLEKGVGAKVTSLQITPKGVATVTVVVVADTILLRRVSSLEDFGHQHATEIASGGL